MAQSALAKLPMPAKAGIIVGWLVLAAVVYWVVFYGDLASSMKAARGQEQSLRSDLGEARKAEFAYEKDLAELTDRQQRQSELNKVLPQDPQYASFLSSIQEVANVSGVNLVAWTPREVRAEDFYARVPMQLELTGKFHQVAKFFYQVGQLDRIINMENISITDSEVENDEIRAKVQVLATAFMTRPEASADAGQGKGKGRGGKDAAGKPPSEKKK